MLCTAVFRSETPKLHGTGLEERANWFCSDLFRIFVTESVVYFEHFSFGSFIDYFRIHGQEIFIMVGAGGQLNKTYRQFQ